VGGSLAVHRSVILVQLPDDSSLAGNGNSNCSSRFLSLLVLALRLTAVSGASLAQLSYAAHAATNSTLLVDRLKDFVVVSSSACGNSSCEQHSQSMEERVTLNRYYHFHGHSGMCA